MCTENMHDVSFGYEKLGSLRDRFQIGTTLGRGTYAKVRVARDRTTGEKVALKCLRKSRLREASAVKRVESEIAAMRSVTHPNIIQLIDVLETEDRLVLVQEYAAGGELYDYLNNGPLTPSDAQRIFSQLTQAVAHCHENGIIHRDLKLENILLDDEMNVKLADFGLATSYTAGTQITGFCGSVLYASPEVLSRTAYTGPELDCWSLGVLLFTMVHGCMPFGGEPSELKARVLQACYRQPQHVPGASQIITALLQPDSCQRATVKDLLNSEWLTEVLHSETSEDENKAKDAVFIQVTDDSLSNCNTKDSGLGLEDSLSLSLKSSDLEKSCSGQLLDVPFSTTTRPRALSLSSQSVDV